MSPALVVLLLSLLLGLQPVTTDLYLPALPALKQSFGATMAQAQLTLSALLLAFGLSHLVWGPLADRYGRRPVLLLGLSAYVLAAIASAMAASMQMLIALRAVQGVAMGASVVCARAIVRDLYPPAEGTRMMSKGLTGLGVLACASTPLGGLLTEVFNWHAALLALAVFAALTLALVALRFKETAPLHTSPASSPRALLQTWSEIARNPTFRAFSALASASYGGLFTLLATSPFVFIGALGYSSLEYGALMFSVSAVYIAGTFACRWLLARVGVRRSVAIAAGFTLAGGTMAGVASWAGWIEPGRSVVLIVPMVLFMLAHGVHQSCGQGGAVGPFPQAAGAAAALNGFVMMVVAFAMGSWLGTHMDQTVLTLSQGLWFWSVCIAAVAWSAVRKHSPT